MRLKVIQSGRWTILSPIVGNSSECIVEQFFEAYVENYESSVTGLLRMAEMHSSQGPTAFNPKQLHYVDQKEKIYQWRKGDLRLLWFADEGRVIICLHGILKKSQETPKREIKQAIRIKQEYLDAKARNGISIEEE